MNYHVRMSTLTAPVPDVTGVTGMTGVTGVTGVRP
jgi:hypothetical protein